MRTKSVVWISFFTLVCLQSLIAQAAVDYYPLNVGDYWIYRADTLASVYDPATYRVDIPGTDTVDSKVLYQLVEALTADDGDPAWLWCTWVHVDDEGAKFFAFGDSAWIGAADFFDTPVMWCPHQAVELGYTWQFSSYEMGGDFTFLVEDTAASVTVPAGSFDNCIKLEMIVQNAEDSTIQTSWYYYAPGVGLVLQAGSGFWMGGSFRFELTEYHTSTLAVRGEGRNPPDRFILQQNHPNPFNPVSTIGYELPQASGVSLIVYDVLGREVARLVDGYMQAGHYQTRWTAKDANGLELPSGTYIARLTTPESSRSIKMVLLR